MRRKDWFIFPLISIVFLSAISYAQLWSGVLASSRAIDWSNAGVRGGIPSATWPICNTTACNNLAGAGSVTIANINSAINSAQVGGVACTVLNPCVVPIRAGTFSVSGTINMKSGIALRGAGANLTRLNFTGAGGCQAGSCLIVFQGTFNDTGGGFGTTNNLKTWSGTNGQAGVYSQGATVLNLSGVTGSPNLSVGDTLFLKQADVSSPTTGPFLCATSGTCASEGDDANPGQWQHVRVGAINGNAVTISPGLYMPNWATARTPQAYWWGGSVNTAGIEDFTINGGSISTFGSVNFVQTYNCWMRGMGSIETGSLGHVFITLSRNITIRDSYFQNSCTGGCGGGATGYGLVTGYGTSDTLRENNILDNVQAPFVYKGGSTDVVDAYNYVVNSGSASALHGHGSVYNLFEGNVTDDRYTADNYHGTMPLNTAFRNRIVTPGWPVFNIESYNRYYNIIGNVVTAGTGGLYQCIAPAGGACGSFDTVIFRLGYGDGISNDSTATTSLMRWGNCDSVSGYGNCRFVSSEVPSAEPTLPNAVPANNNLPASFYLSSKPTWWPSAKAWPPIGPDVTGGNIANTGGHANTIPAQDCYNSINGNIANFNAASCYALQNAPAPPTSLAAAVQ